MEGLGGPFIFLGSSDVKRGEMVQGPKLLTSECSRLLHTEHRKKVVTEVTGALSWSQRELGALGATQLESPSQAE